MNISASNGAILKIVDLKLAKRGSVKVWGISVKNSTFCLKMSASGNSNCALSPAVLRHSLDLSDSLTYQNSRINFNENFMHFTIQSYFNVVA